MKTAIYTRVSTIDQVDNGYGLEVQLERCQGMAIAKGYNVVAHLSDDGISGTKDETERNGLAQLLQLAIDREIDCVIVHALDRLGRKTQLVLDIVEKLEQAEVNLISCKESLDTTSPQGKFVLTMFAALGQLERDNIVERTTQGRNQRGKIDGEKGGNVPYGYLRVVHNAPSAIEIINQEAAIIKEIFDLRDNQNLSMWKIANALNDNSIPAPRGKKWYASTIKTILSNRDKYLGGKRNGSGYNWPKILK